MKVGVPRVCDRCKLFPSRWSLRLWQGPGIHTEATPKLFLSGYFCKACYNTLNDRPVFEAHVTLKQITERLKS